MLSYALDLLTHHAGFFPSLPHPAVISPWVPVSRPTDRSPENIVSTMMPGITLDQDTDVRIRPLIYHVKLSD